MDPITPIDKTFRLLAQKILVGSLIKLLDVLPAENKSFDSPITVLYLIDFRSDRGHDTKVVSSSLEGPPKIGLVVDGLERAISHDNVERNPLISNDAMMALKPAVTTTKTGAHVANALACSSHFTGSVSYSKNDVFDHTSLLVGGPESVGDLLGLSAASNSCGLAISGDLDLVQLI